MNPKIKDFVKWMIFCNHCVCCGKVIERGKSFCFECEKNKKITGDVCFFCGSEKARCTCKQHKMKYDKIISPFYYEGGVKEGLLSFKFNGNFQPADYFSEAMASAVSERYKDETFDVITFVPFSDEQRLERKYNQSQILCEKVAERLNIGTEALLEKQNILNSQHSTRLKNRSGNVFGVYTIAQGADVRGKRILLVDDIKTTGATLNECSAVLKINGAERVCCVTGAVTILEKMTK